MPLMMALLEHGVVLHARVVGTTTSRLGEYYVPRVRHDELLNRSLRVWLEQAAARLGLHVLDAVQAQLNSANFSAAPR